MKGYDECVDAGFFWYRLTTGKWRSYGEFERLTYSMKIWSGF